MSLSVNIQKRLGDFSLNVQFDTDRELLALLGASGSGKSLTLRCIAGLLTPDQGRILLNDRVLFDREAGINLPPRQRRVGFLFQNYALFPHMTVLQNLEAGLHRLPRPLRRQRALELLDRLRLTRLADAYPATLSGGEQQRTALARTLGAEPEVLLLDEPFSALDDHLKWEVELSLARTLEAYGGDVILVSHNRDEVCRLAKTVCVLDRGRSEPVVTVDRLMRSPGTRSAALLSGCKNLSPVTRLPGGDLLCRDWGWTLPPMAAPADLAWVGIRAHSLRPEPGELSLDCTVDRVIDNVFSHVVMLRTPGPGLLRLERPKGDWTPPPAGSPLTVSTAPDRILLLTGGEPHG